MKWKYMMIPVLIQGPKQLGNDIDVYLRPLVDELLLLWKEEGVRVWDEYKQENFDLRALLFVTINDWPALSNLSGQSNKGYQACTHCLEETDSLYLKNCRKVVYMDHRRFLPLNHPLRRKGKHFKGEPETRAKPIFRNGKRVFSMVKDVHVVFGRSVEANKFRMMKTAMPQCGRRSPYYGSSHIGMSWRSATQSM